MNHQAFDARMKQRAQKEVLTASAEAQQRFQLAMQAGAQRMKQGRGQRSWQRVLAVSTAVAMIAAAIFLIQPPSDQFNRSAVSSDQTIWNTPVPVTVPECTVGITVSNRTLHAEATLSNHTGDIWLMQWEAQPMGNVQKLAGPTGLIWLETGITFTDHASWKLTGGWEEQPAQAQWAFTGYRVEEKLLHWIEGEWLMPGSDGYEEQQMLIEDAFANGALILAPGDWPEGTSGEMQLVLPDRFQQENPSMDALSYYVQSGVLVKAAQGQGIVSEQK